MATTWTREQQQVIELRNQDLLVSAAAGSGKTAVLVERIIKKITDPEHPVDIDHLLVVTFTKAAAAEMRERITQELSARLNAQPGDANLIRQSALIHNASISTIDSFCMFVVRNHFGEIGIDPNFRMADEGEIRLLEQDVLTDLFETEYQQASADFLNLVDAYSSKRNDDVVRDMVMKIYQMSQSTPWPQKWIAALPDSYQLEEDFNPQENPILMKAAETLSHYFAQFCHKTEEFLELANRPDGVPKYIPVLEQDLLALKAGQDIRDYFTLSGIFTGLTFPSLPKIMKPANAAVKDAISKGRTDMIKKIQTLQKNYAGGKEEFLSSTEQQLPYIRTLSHLASSFLDRMAAQKARRRIVDFSDIAHFALKILVDEETCLPSRTAEEFRRHYEEIMIDEYQDSNMVQEAILTAISGHPDTYNVFMVGDVKQSIYRFRQARPELFMEKYAAFSETEGPRRKIELHNNFRSRREVLEFANDLFYKLMAEDLGGVAYNEAAALYPGASYPEDGQMAPEILLLSKDTIQELQSGLEGESEDPAKEAEAILIAGKIREMMRTMQVTDKKTREKRPLKYSDIVILFRSYKDYADTFSDVFSAYDIPLHIESSTGYFTASEIQWMLDFLRILYNPLQDIPMASVLKSPFAAISDEELAQIRTDHPTVSFSQAVCEEMRSEESMLYSFGQAFSHFRSLSRELPIHQLIQRILSETGYGNYIASLPGGKSRLANLDMLIEKAVNFEQTSYKGLFHFVRYIDQLQKYDVDYGEADMVNENADVVRLMTIHKSKGLEFPVVFVSGLSKQFFTTDSSDKLVLHCDLGAGLVHMTATPRTKCQTLYHAQIGESIRQEALGEQLRVLYVALTRAKEKLILTAVTDSEENVYKKHRGNVTPHQPLPFELRRNAASFTDWIINAVLSYPEKYKLRFISAEELLLPAVKNAAEETLAREDLMKKIALSDSDIRASIEEAFRYTYPYPDDIGRKSKYSVSELKHNSMVENLDRMEGGMEKPDFLKEEKEAYIPRFAAIRNQEEDDGQLLLPFGAPSEKASAGFSAGPGINPGALRGTAVHKVMECLDFAAIGNINTQDSSAVRLFVKDQLKEMYDSGKLTADMRNLIRPQIIEAFTASPIARRMAAADQKGNLFREKPFVMEYHGVLLQGIIDVFWFEDDEIVLLDYKTDRVERADELVLLYRTQLELYKNALERIFSGENHPRKVKEAILYSFRLQEVISI